MDDEPVVVAGNLGGKEPLPPTWDGADPTATFPVFEKNVRLWEFESELDEKKRGVRLLRSLTGVARAAGDSLEFEDVATHKGVSNIMSCLREHFAPHLEVSLPRAFGKSYLWPTTTSPGESSGVLDQDGKSLLPSIQRRCHSPGHCGWLCDVPAGIADRRPGTSLWCLG